MTIETTNTKKTKLTELGSDKSKYKAAPGKFKACLGIGSTIHQIGEDTDRQTAWDYTEEYPGEPTQIFDENGYIHIIKCKLKKL